VQQFSSRQHSGQARKQECQRDPEDIMSMNSVLVLPIAREERLKSGDPRPSLAERYPEAADRIRSSARRQTTRQDRLLLM
jgi:hypothetical protein